MVLIFHFCKMFKYREKNHEPAEMTNRTNRNLNHSEPPVIFHIQYNQLEPSDLVLRESNLQPNLTEKSQDKNEDKTKDKPRQSKIIQK